MFFPVLFCGVWGAAAGDLLYSHRTVVGPASERPGLSLPLSSCFNTEWPGQSRRKAPQPPPFSLCPVLYLTSLRPHHIATRAEQEGESPSSSLNTLLHSKRDKRKGGLLYQILVVANGRCNSLKYSVGNLFQTWSGSLLQFSHTRRTNPSLNSPPQLLPSHVIESFFKVR